MARYWFYTTYLLLLYCSDFSHAYRSGQIWRHSQFSYYWPQRVYTVIAEYYEDLSRKTELLHDIRFSYEVSPRYEMGYIMGEIVERYRKMVETLKRPIKFRSDAVFVTIKRVNMIQALYFEIYHLVNMMHEIPRKYNLNDDLSKPQEVGEVTQAFDNNKRAHEAQDTLVRNKRDRERIKKQRLRDMKKMRELMLKGQYHTERTKRPKNRWWPIDYGWEIDYYW